MAPIGRRKDGRFYPKGRAGSSHGVSVDTFAQLHRQDEKRHGLEMSMEFAKRHIMRVRESARKSDTGLNTTTKQYVVNSLKNIEAELDRVENAIKQNT
jgi:hypothetical protein